MGDVVDLAEQQRARAARVAVEREMHPSLRYVAGTTFYVAHAKDVDSGAAKCGAAGDLILAPPGVPLCVSCYPPAARVEQVPS